MPVTTGEHADPAGCSGRRGAHSAGGGRGCRAADGRARTRDPRLHRSRGGQWSRRPRSGGARIRRDRPSRHRRHHARPSAGGSWESGSRSCGPVCRCCSSPATPTTTWSVEACSRPARRSCRSPSSPMPSPERSGRFSNARAVSFPAMDLLTEFRAHLPTLDLAAGPRAGGRLRRSRLGRAARPAPPHDRPPPASNWSWPTWITAFIPTAVASPPGSTTFACGARCSVRDRLARRWARRLARPTPAWRATPGSPGREPDSAAAFVFTAHHADDQAETVLMRLLGGQWTGGPRRACGRSPAGWCVRCCRSARRACSEYVRARDLPVWIDPANSDPVHLRSWIRVEALPFLRRRVPAVDRASAPVGSAGRSRSAGLGRPAGHAARTSIRARTRTEFPLLGPPWRAMIQRWPKRSLWRGTAGRMHAGPRANRLGAGPGGARCERQRGAARRGLARRAGVRSAADLAGRERRGRGSSGGRWRDERAGNLGAVASALAA